MVDWEDDRVHDTDQPGVSTAPIDHVGAFVGDPRVLRTGAPDGPLAGATLGVKDLFDLAGLVTGAGNPAYAATHERARRDAVAVTRLVDAGATVVGKTVTDELAWSLAGVNRHHGAPRNVAAPGRRAGGSSSGSAAAVAAALVDLGLGTDTGGSIRVPASHCGIFGWRPTHGAVPSEGVVPLAPSFDTVGLLSRDPRLLRLGAEALLGTRATMQPLPGTIRGIAEAWAVVDDELRDGLRGLTGGEATPIGIDLTAGAEAFRTLQGWQVWREHGRWFQTTTPDMAADIAARFHSAARITADDAQRARAVADHFARQVHAATASGDVLVCTAAPGPAPLLVQTDDESAAWRARALELTSIAGLAGAPVVVAPLLEQDGLPVGAAFLGPPGSDLALTDLVADRFR
jgi:amidase